MDKSSDRFACLCVQRYGFFLRDMVVFKGVCTADNYVSAFLEDDSELFRDLSLNF